MQEATANLSNSGLRAGAALAAAALTAAGLSVAGVAGLAGATAAGAQVATPVLFHGAAGPLDFRLCGPTPWRTHLIPIALSSPNVADLKGVPSVVVGDGEGHLYRVARWPTASRRPGGR